MNIWICHYVMNYNQIFSQSSSSNKRGSEIKLSLQSLELIFDFDLLNRRTLITYPDGSTEAKTYDAIGRVLSTTDPLGNAISYEYDAADRVTASIDPLGNTTTSAHDAIGNLLSVDSE